MAPPNIAPPPVPRLTWPGPLCPSPVTDSNRIIGYEEIYNLDLVKDLVRAHGVVVLNDDTLHAMSGKGKNPLPAPAWTSNDAKNIIFSLKAGHFENAQWCKLNTNRYLDCDSYVIYYSRSKGIEWNNSKTKGLKLYVKFGFIPDATNPMGILCRLHPSEH